MESLDSDHDEILHDLCARMAEQLRKRAESARLRAELYAKQMHHFKALMHAEQALEHKLNRASSALLALQETE